MVCVSKTVKIWENPVLRQDLQNIFMNLLVLAFNFAFSDHELCICSTVLDS